MKVKIFSDTGFDGIGKVEAKINAWLKEGIREVTNTQTALCQVAESSNGERYQCLVITIWYDEL